MKIITVFFALVLLSTSAISDDSDRDSDSEEESAHASYYYFLNLGCRALRCTGYGVMYGCIGVTATIAIQVCGLGAYYFCQGVESLPSGSLSKVDSGCSSDRNVSPDPSEDAIYNYSPFLRNVVVAPIWEELFFRRILQPIYNWMLLGACQYLEHRDPTDTDTADADLASNIFSSTAFSFVHDVSRRPQCPPYFIRAISRTFVHYYIYGRCYRRHGLVTVIISHATNNAAGLLLANLLIRFLPSPKN